MSEEAAQPAPAPATRPEEPSRWRLLPVLCVLQGLAMLWFTWDAWPDVLIDSGRESYVAWRLAEGDVLYRDVMVFNGPLSPYLNAMWMKLLGPSLRSIEFGNALVIVAVAILIYRGATYLADRFAACAAVALFLSVFAFGNLSLMDSCSFMFPYSHEMTHGALLLFLLLLWIALKHRRPATDARGRALLDAVIGVTLGLLFLTKVELFVAGFTAAGVSLLLDARTPLCSVSRAVLSAIIIAALAAAPPLIACALLARYMTFADALHGVLGSWNHIGNRELTGMLYFKLWMGLVEPAGNLVKIVMWSLAWAVVIGVITWVMLRWRRRPGQPENAEAGAPFVFFASMVATGVTLAATYLVPRNIWLDMSAALPVGAIMVLVIALRRWWTADDTNRPRWSLAVCAGVLAMVLMLKLGIWPRVWHYGFVLALPAALLITVGVVGWLGTWVTRRGGRGDMFAFATTMLLLLYMAGHGVHMRSVHREKRIRVQSNGDTIVADVRGRAVEMFLNEFGHHAPPGATLAVLPEGAMLNFLARRRNPTPYVFALPSDLAMFGEERVFDAYKQNPPDFVVLAHRDTKEYGYRFFGEDYARPFMAWLKDNYEPAGLVGAMPFQSEKFGLLVLRRKAAPPRR